MSYSSLVAGTRQWLVLSGLLMAVACGGDDSNDSANSCTPGTQNCPCIQGGQCAQGLVCDPTANACVAPAAGCVAGQFACTCRADGSCDAGLVCNGNVCAQAASTGGSAGTGGATGSGGGTGTGGTDSTGGSSTTGGTTGACGDTLSDPNNCGQCGHVCAEGSCSNGQCPPTLGTCIGGTAGITTCEGYCTSIGESCGALGCDNATFYSFATENNCASYVSTGFSPGITAHEENCVASIPWSELDYVTCCCTDTP